MNVEIQAADWFARLHAAEVDADDWRAFESWRNAAPEHAETYARLEAAWQTAVEAVDDAEIAALLNDARGLRASRGVWRVAAAAAGIAAIVAGASWLTIPDQVARIATAPLQLLDDARDQGHFATAVGERSTIKLRDGSVLTLDTNSEVMVAFGSAERNISLLRGQVMFEVAPDKARPFIVAAGDRRIVAVGTAFSVRLDDKAVSVALVEGSVVVEELPAPNDARPKARTPMQPGERLIAKAGAAASVTTANIEQVTSWRAGKLMFLDTPLKEAIAEINRYSGDKVVLVDGSVADVQVNGVFRTGQPMDFARAVAEVYPVALDRQRPGEIRIVSRR